MSVEMAVSYQTRPIRHLEVWEHDGWRVKVYGISALDALPPMELVDAIKQVAGALLPRPAVATDRYGVGFLYAHQGRNGGGYASVNWWGNENELFHFQYESTPERIGDLRPIEETGGSCACVWDLAVIDHERRAWMDLVLTNQDGPDFEAYLRAELNADL
jgi:hypothetical protein